MMQTDRLKPSFLALATSCVLSSSPPAFAQGCSDLNLEFNVYFQSESVELTPQAKDVVDQAISNIVQSSQSKRATGCVLYPVKITGHTDRYGSQSKNQALSSAMAYSVADYLIGRHGISANAMNLSAEGENRLAVPTGDNEKRAENRRVTVAFEFGDG